MSRKLWGEEIKLPCADGPEVPDFAKLSKKQRRLLAAARAHRVTAKGDSSHFDTLVAAGLLSPNGDITPLGRACFDDRGEEDDN